MVWKSAWAVECKVITSLTKSVSLTKCYIISLLYGKRKRVENKTHEIHPKTKTTFHFAEASLKSKVHKYFVAFIIGDFFL